ncbi:MAG TPA: outer membrane beta-barrel family protein [Chitinophagaceae bacterium]|nr:outer membrane beta-barrel family protein [Chitinophagaceae bacterium]
MRLLLLFLLAAITVSSQAQQIKGLAKDENGSPLVGVTISLMRVSDSAVVKLAISKSDGLYSFSGIKEGNYKVMASYVGFKPAYSPGFSFAAADISVAEIKLTRISGNLGNVTVTAQKPMVEVKADKTILNVEGTINAMGSNALELLRKSPGVLLDKDDNISLAGKNGVQVYVDGRSTPLAGQDLANYLKTMQSSQIEAIELITNPSAKYDAAGNAGIINIRLKKNKSLGTNGAVNAGWNIAQSSKYNAGASLNYRNAKINIFSTYNYSYTPNHQNITIKRTILDSLFDQAGTIYDLRKSHNFKIGADYFLDKKNTIGVTVNGVLADPTSNTSNRTVISNTTTNTVDRILLAENSTTMKRHNANINLNYSYTDPKGTSLVINADRGAYTLNSDQLQPNDYYDATGQVKMSNVTYHMLSPAEIHINSLKADYEQNFMKGKLGFGAKSAWVKTDNDFQRYNVYGSGENLDKDRSNHFVYKENINAGYVNYNRQYKKMMLQVGLRVENTVSEGVSNGLKLNGSSYVPSISSFKRSYIDLFPSAAITFNKNPMKQWSLTYSRRIDRPAYQDLNPFEFKLDEYTFMKGNINLRPQYTNSFGITHIYKYKLNIALNYSHVKDLFTQIIDTAEKSKAFVSKKNLATQDIASLTVSYPFQYKAYSLFVNVSTNYSRYKADFGTGRKVDLSAFGFNLFAQNSLKFAKTWTAEISGFFNAPTLYQGSFKGKTIYNVDAGISKQILKGKATVKASVSDIFYSLKFRATADFAGQITNFSFRQESRQFKLSFNLRFGNNGVKAARQRTSGAEDELKRVQQSNGMGMGNN